MSEKAILAIVGMPGAGKSEAVRFLIERGFASVRLGEETDRGLIAAGLSLTEENERVFRARIRKELGMAAYAIKAKPKIEEAIMRSNAVVLDGLYSWEEYKYLSKDFPKLRLICVFTDSNTRYQRLAARSVRPLSQVQARKRDLDEIEKLNKAGPIGIADHIIDNNGTIEELRKKLDALLQKLGIV